MIELLSPRPSRQLKRGREKEEEKAINIIEAARRLTRRVDEGGGEGEDVDSVE